MDVEAVGAASILKHRTLITSLVKGLPNRDAETRLDFLFFHIKQDALNIIP